MIFKLVSRRGFLVSLGALTFGVVACQSQTPKPEATNPSPDSETSNESIILYGAGATFPSFLYLRWFSEYNRLHPNIQITYQPIGSAAGIQQLLTGTLDFGASEIPLTGDEIARVDRGVVPIPATAGSIAVVYNLPGIQGRLKLSRQVLPEIFLGKIKQWNDPKIAALNPGIKLPKQPILLVHRSDGSGTTAVFTAHLSAISPEWKEKVGSGLSVQWAAGTGIKDNAGISAQIQQAEGSIGYVEYAFAKQLGLSIAALENKAGQYVEPNNDTVAKAIATLKLPENLQGSLPDPEGAESYPIVTYSWLMLYKRYATAPKAKALKELLRWGLTEGQKFASELGYVPLPEEVVKQASGALDQINS